MRLWKIHVFDEQMKTIFSYHYQSNSKRWCCTYLKQTLMSVSVFKRHNLQWNIFEKISQNGHETCFHKIFFSLLAFQTLQVRGQRASLTMGEVLVVLHLTSKSLQQNTCFFPSWLYRGVWKVSHQGGGGGHHPHIQQTPRTVKALAPHSSKVRGWPFTFFLTYPVARI